MTRGLRIGIDFDNTIVIYDEVFTEAGIKQGFLPSDFTGTKDHIRSVIRALPDGEVKWTALQAEVYGPGLMHAQMAPGLREFLIVAKQHHCAIFIVSHKSEYAAAAPDGVNLRDAARQWLKTQMLTGEVHSPLTEDRVFFADTRAKKIEQIAALNCDHFIDDLEEVFLEPAFPETTERHLIKFGSLTLPTGPFRPWRHWLDLQKAIFNE